MILNKDDDCLTKLAAIIYGEHVWENLFQCLGVDKQIIFAEKEMYFHKRKSYKYKRSMLKLLIRWTEIAGREATVLNLHTALQKSGFMEPAARFLVFVEEQVAKQKDSEHRVQVLKEKTDHSSNDEHLYDPSLKVPEVHKLCLQVPS